MARRKKAKSGDEAPTPAAEPAILPASYNHNLPAVAQDGKFLAQAGKYARGVTLAAFQGIGGVRRLTEVADEDPKWFYEKLFAKLVQPERQIVAESDDDVEDLLKKLDRKVVDVDEVVSTVEDDNDNED